MVEADPDDFLRPVETRNSEVLSSNPGRVGYLSSWLYLIVQCSKLFKGPERPVLCYCALTHLCVYIRTRVPLYIYYDKKRQILSEHLPVCTNFPLP